MSRTKPKSMAMNMELVRTTVMMESKVVLPVSMGERPASCWAAIHLGKTSEKKMEKPRTKRFLVELRSTNCRLERPTAVMMPNMTVKIPPMIGLGMVTMRAASLEKIPKRIMMAAAHWITLLLPTWGGQSKVHQRGHNSKSILR